MLLSSLLLSRRTLGKAVAMVFGGAGGLPPRRPDQVHDPAPPSLGAGPRTIGPQPFVVIFGSGSRRGLFVYSGPPAAGNLIASIAATSGTDFKGNAYQAGIASYFPGSTATFGQLVNAELIFSLPASVLAAVIAAPIAGRLSLDPGETGAGDSRPVVFIDSKNSVAGPGVPQVVIGVPPVVPATQALLEVQGKGQFSGVLTPGAGTNSSGSAPSPPQALVLNAAAAQLSDLTRDYELYLVFTGAGNVTVQAGPTSGVGRTPCPTVAITTTFAFPLRVPAGWFVKLTGTGTVTLASQTVIGC